MPEARAVVKRPIVTEKSVMQTASSQYSFEVAASASKHRIKAAVQDIFRVKVLRVNTVSVRGKRKRDLRRRTAKPTVKHPDWKKAIVTLREGDKIELGGVNYFES
ncbi:MAG: 50S ribosomal protein L23 [Candidatus Eremiobacteraeota bacterium]|nr:50S ribosomal protein L23 [Candidatus Eremiobacteraeota bacterium]MBC5828294.1 50S ribosomal protein L23 [Candidatus Eremiobacteraeota bacterium]